MLVELTLFIAIGVLVIASITLGYCLGKSYSVAALHLDCVTQLPTRVAFERDLDRALSDFQCVRILLIDLDNFKAVNDAYGHLVGDQILASVAKNLQAETAAQGTLYRWGGDEFIVIFNAESSATTKVDVDIEAFFAATKFTAGEMKMTLSCSLGWAESTENDCMATIFQRADESLYKHKR
jgi:diguanylate cyclase (GGDEF)-like protein